MWCLSPFKNLSLEFYLKTGQNFLSLEAVEEEKKFVLKAEYIVVLDKTCIFSAGI